MFKIGDIVVMNAEGRCVSPRYSADQIEGFQHHVLKVNAETIEIETARGKKYYFKEKFDIIPPAAPIDKKAVAKERAKKFLAELDGEKYDEPKKAIIKPVEVKNELRDELTKKVGGQHIGGSACHYAIRFKEAKDRFHTGDVCHARLAIGNYHGNKELEQKGITEVALCVKTSDDCAGHKEWKAYMTWMMNESPWAHTFLTKDYTEGMERGITMDVHVKTGQLVGAAIALRAGTEHPCDTKLFYKLVEAGYSGNAAFIVSRTITQHSDTVYMHRNFNAGHQPMKFDIVKEAGISFFTTGYDQEHCKLDVPYKDLQGAYKLDMWYGIVGGDSFNAYLAKKFPAPIVGGGWEAVQKGKEKHFWAYAEAVEQMLKEKK